MLAPSRPFYMTMNETTIDTKLTLVEINMVFPEVFEAHGFTVSPSELIQSGFTCVQGDLEIEVTIFQADPPSVGHQIEFRRMCGCRHEFGAMVDAIADSLNMEFRCGRAVGIPMSPPPFPKSSTSFRMSPPSQRPSLTSFQKLPMSPYIPTYFVPINHL